MSDEPPVVVGIGLTQESDYVLQKVSGLANSPDRVIAIHAIERNVTGLEEEASGSLESLYQQLFEDARIRLTEICSKFGITDCRVMHGSPASVLHQVAEEVNAMAIVVGSHGLQGWRALLGETADAVLRDVRNNVLSILVRDLSENPALTYNRVLIAVDMSEEANLVIESGLRVAALFNAEPVLMSSIKPVVQYAAMDETTILGSAYDDLLNDAESALRTRLDELGDTYGIHQVMIRHGHPPTEIHDAARAIEADLIVLGTHGRSGAGLLFGSTPSAVMQGVNCDVLAVRVGD